MLLLWPQLQAAEHPGGAPGPLPQLSTESGVPAGSQHTKPRYSATAGEEANSHSSDHVNVAYKLDRFKPGLHKRIFLAI